MKETRHKKYLKQDIAEKYEIAKNGNEEKDTKIEENENNEENTKGKYNFLEMI